MTPPGTDELIRAEQRQPDEHELADEVEDAGVWALPSDTTELDEHSSPGPHRGWRGDLFTPPEARGSSRVCGRMRSNLASSNLASSEAATLEGIEPRLVSGATASCSLRMLVISGSAPRVALRPRQRIAGTGGLGRAAAAAGSSPGRGAAVQTSLGDTRQLGDTARQLGDSRLSPRCSKHDHYDLSLDEAAPPMDAVLSGEVFRRSTSRTRLHSKPSGALSPSGSRAALHPAGGRPVSVASFGFTASSFGVRDAPSTPPHAGVSSAPADSNMDRVLLVTPSHVQTHAAAQLAAHAAPLPVQTSITSPRRVRQSRLAAVEAETDEPKSPKLGRAGPAPSRRVSAPTSVYRLDPPSEQAAPAAAPSDDWLDGLGLRAAHELLEQQKLELQCAGTPSLSDDNSELPLEEMLASLQLSAISQWQAQRLQDSIGGAG